MKAQPPIRKDQRRKVKRRSRPQRMLNAGRQVEFQYFLKEIVQKYEISDAEGEPFMASFIARAMREGSNEAMDYINEKIEAGFLPSEADEEIFRLLKRFSTLR